MAKTADSGTNKPKKWLMPTIQKLIAIGVLQRTLTSTGEKFGTTDKFDQQLQEEAIKLLKAGKLRRNDPKDFRDHAVVLWTLMEFVPSHTMSRKEMERLPQIVLAVLDVKWVEKWWEVKELGS